jgi:phage FluMu protein Com
VSSRAAWLELQCPECGAAPGARCGGWRWGRRGQARWVASARLHVARGWLERTCPTCQVWPQYPCVTPNGHEASGIHKARRGPIRGELLGRPDVWEELDQRGATIATVPFWGRAGAGGHPERITLLRAEGETLSEVERWSSRGELAYALEAPVWDRFGTFLGHPLVRGQVTWWCREQVVEIAGTRGQTRFTEQIA